MPCLHECIWVCTPVCLLGRAAESGSTRTPKSAGCSASQQEGASSTAVQGASSSCTCRHCRKWWPQDHRAQMGLGLGFFHFTCLFSLPSCPSGSNGSRCTLSLYSWFVVPTTLLLWLSLLCGVSLKCSFKISPYCSCNSETLLCAWLANKGP